ncbi:MAG TPA: hypothetical protein VJT31_06105 [Rugosimonospora sp.]|nr:hypothetical protein [Rugosimonospora sp.]
MPSPTNASSSSTRASGAQQRPLAGDPRAIRVGEPSGQVGQERVLPAQDLRQRRAGRAVLQVSGDPGQPR